MTSSYHSSHNSSGKYTWQPLGRPGFNSQKGKLFLSSMDKKKSFSVNQAQKVQEYLVPIRKSLVSSAVLKTSILSYNLQSLAIKFTVSISVIRKLAVVFIPVEIQKFV